MRRIVGILLLGLILAGCGSDETIAGLTRRQQTATAAALISPTPTRVRPTSTAFILPSTTPTRDLGPITITPIPQLITETETPEATEEPTPAPPTSTPIIQPTAAPVPPRLASGTLFFQRDGAVWRFDSTGKAARVTSQGALMRAAPQGSRLVVVENGDLVLIEGSTRTPLASNVVEAPAWSPDGQALAIVRDEQPDQGYFRACTPGSQLEIIELATQKTRVIGEGCQPAWDAQSRRLAYVTPEIGADSQGFNSVALVSRAGENGWTPASAPLSSAVFPDERHIFYRPFWSADGEALYALAYVGYRLLSDVSTLERIDPTNGGSAPIGIAFDVDPQSVRALPDGSAIVYTILSPKGTLRTAVLATDGTPHRFDYFGTPIEVANEPQLGQEFTSAPVWSPRGDLLALVYCQSDPYGCQPGDRATVKLLDPATGLERVVIEDVDPESTLEWSR